VCRKGVNVESTSTGSGNASRIFVRVSDLGIGGIGSIFLAGVGSILFAGRIGNCLAVSGFLT
jgi:hypothetical protein